MTKAKVYGTKKVRLSKAKTVGLILFGTLLGSIASYYFIFVLEIFIPGLGGIINGIVYTIKAALPGNPVISDEAFKPTAYWIMYIIANIPIIYLTIRWYSNRFLGLSLLQFFTSFATVMFFTYTPGFRIEDMGGYLEFFNDDAASTIIPALSIAALAGLMWGTGNGIIYKVGGCTMGLDPVLRYFSRERGKNIGSLMFVVFIINTTVWTFVLFGIDNSGDSITWTDFIQGTIFSKTYLYSWSFVIAFTFATNAMYASNKKVEIRVKSIKVPEMSTWLNQHRFHRGHTLLYVEGGYSKEKRVDLQIIVNIEEINDVVEKFAAIDPESLITVTDIRKVFDVRKWNPITDDDKKKQLQIAKHEQKRSERLAKAKAAREAKKKNKKTTEN